MSEQTAENNTVKKWVLGVISGVILLVAGKITDMYINRSNDENKSQVQTESIPASSQSQLKKNIQTNLYKGNVGKWSANFQLTFNYDNNELSGSYTYPNRPGVIYKIRGVISGNNIEFTEYTDSKATATCQLETTDQSCYAGVMNNTDGKVLAINFCKE